MNVWKI